MEARGLWGALRAPESYTSIKTAPCALFFQAFQLAEPWCGSGPGCPRVGGIGGWGQLLLNHSQEVEQEKREEMLYPATFAADRNFIQECSLGWAAYSALCTWAGPGKPSPSAL